MSRVSQTDSTQVRGVETFRRSRRPDGQNYANTGRGRRARARRWNEHLPDRRSPSVAGGNGAAMATQTPHIRVVEGREVPPPGRWALDPVHSQIQFVARHMMVSKVRGFFREFSGTLLIAEVPEESHVEVTIAAASIDTGDKTRDEHLRSPEFLDVERFPEITYRSTRVRPAA